MILEFSIENFKSFKSKQTFSLLADKSKKEYKHHIVKISEKLQVLPSAVIYGANASGKSNLMKAFQELRKMVLLSGKYTPKEKLSAYIPFQFNSDLTHQPTYFELYFLLYEVRYLFQLSILNNQVVTEKLFFYPQGRKAKLFVRKGQKFEFGDALKGQKAIIADLTAPNQLFLSKAAQNNLEQLKEVFLYFETSLMAIPFLHKEIDGRYLHLIAKMLSKQKSNSIYIKNFRQLLKSFDTGVVDFKIKKKPKTTFHNAYYEVFTEHFLYNSNGEKIGRTLLPLQEESEGTQKLFVLGGLILRALMNGRTIIIDEFERSLHPHISQYIVQIFNKPEINIKKAQLIIATHDSNLLTKNNPLRRDQIWIVEKNSQEASELFALSDFADVRAENPFERWYLTGKLGGVPSILSLDFELNFQHEAA